MLKRTAILNNFCKRANRAVTFYNPETEVGIVVYTYKYVPHISEVKTNWSSSNNLFIAKRQKVIHKIFRTDKCMIFLKELNFVFDGPFKLHYKIRSEGSSPFCGKCSRVYSVGENLLIRQQKAGHLDHIHIAKITATSTQQVQVSNWRTRLHSAMSTRVC